MNDALEEKQAVRHMVGDLAVEVLWSPRVKHASGDTELHHVEVWQEEGKVVIEVKKVR